MKWGHFLKSLRIFRQPIALLGGHLFGSSASATSLEFLWVALFLKYLMVYKIKVIALVFGLFLTLCFGENERI